MRRPLDAARAFALAAVVVVGRSADEGGGGFIADMPELREPPDHAGDRLRAEPGHAVDDLGAARQRRIGLDRAGDRGVEGAQFGPHRLEDRGEGPGDNRGRPMLALLLDPLLDLFQARPGLHQPVDLLARGIVRVTVDGGKGFGEPSDRVGVDRVVLGKPSGRLGEMANAFRIDDMHLDASRPQGLRPIALITAARLHHRPPDPVGAQPGDQFGLSLRRVRLRQAQRNRADAGVDFALCDIEADKARLLWHHPTPFLARTGSHAHATVRVEGRHRTSPSLHHRVPPWGHTGSGLATGGCSSNRPFANSGTFCGHKGVRLRHGTVSGLGAPPSRITLRKRRCASVRRGANRIGGGPREAEQL